MVSNGDPLIQQWFPSLSPDDFEITSPEDPAYNCIAWAAGKTDRWWQAVRAAGYYWPDDLPWDDRIDTLVRVFESVGFEVCDSDVVEPGYEKVAIYGQGDEYLHAARLLQSGKWTSKLGAYKDIEHNNLQGLTSDVYGSVVKLLRKHNLAPPDTTPEM